MKFNYKLAMVIALAVVGLSMQARRGGGHRGYRGGRGYRHGGYRRRGYYRRPYYRRGYGYPYGGVGFSISSAPRVYNDCAYARPSASYYRYKRQVTDPIKDQNGYYSWLRNNYPNWRSEWNQFQSYLDYRSCTKSNNKPRVGVSFGVGGGYGGYGYRRGWGW